MIWTHYTRHRLYAEVFKRFGSHATWPLKSRPEDSVGYSQFCQNFANQIGASSGLAVRQQINFATQETYSYGKQAKNCILNKSAALVEGFIVEKDLMKIKDRRVLPTPTHPIQAPSRGRIAQFSHHQTDDRPGA